MRIARRLDPSLTVTSYWAMPERLAVLRQRYPGAPEHWLELVARRAIIVEPVQVPTPDPLESPTVVELALPSGERSRMLQTPSEQLHRPAPRPTVRFPTAESGFGRKSRAFFASAGSGRAATKKKHEPTLSSARVRNPIANVLRIEHRKHRAVPLRFQTDDARRSRVEVAKPESQYPVRKEIRPVFAEVDGRGLDRPELSPTCEAQPAGGENLADIRWPEARRGIVAAPCWPEARAISPPRNAHFSELDNRWPELPKLEDEVDALRASLVDEAALIAEQMGGKWSA
ncbi:MAG TPA: hypothetical protein VGH90_07200 [Chthoniobacteraceae bacterium]